MKNSAVSRVFKLETVNFFEWFWQFMVVIVIMNLMTKMNDVISSGFISVMFGLAIPLTLTLQRYTAYFTQCVGYGATRSAFILGGLMMKPVYAMFAVLINLVTQLFERGGLFALPIVNAAMFALIGSALGDLLGILMLRIGRVGLVIYFIVYIGGFAVAGGLAGAGILDMISFGNEQMSLLIGLICAAVGLIAVSLAVTSILIRRIEVR